MTTETRTWRAYRWVLAVVALVFIASCSSRQENLAALEPDDLFSRGAAAMEERNYDEAIRFLEFFTTANIGHPQVPTARMMLGDAYMARRDYTTAAVHYQRFINDFPFDERSLEARFKTCEAYYRLSPAPELDQEYTVAAALHCESVAEYYPGTEEAEQALAYVDELRNKLALKAYNTGMHYFRRRAYDSAVVYFEDVLRSFPRTGAAPLALAQLVEAYDRLGYVEDAAEARERLLREYPESPQARALAAGVD